MKRLAFRIAATIVLCSVAECLSSEQAQTNSQEFLTRASFGLDVQKSTNLKRGKSSLEMTSAFATYTNEFFGGKTNALKVQFFSQPLTEKDRVNLLKDDTREISRHGYAALVLFLDERKQVWQVNLTYVIPGTTVVRTVAANREELTEHFSDFNFDRHRLRLKSRGNSRSAADTEVLTLSWDTDFDLPVFDQIKK